jgi:Flp pilus assembly protein TadD
MNDELTDPTGLERRDADEQAAEDESRPSLTPSARASDGSLVPSATIALGDAEPASGSSGHEDATPPPERSKGMTRVGLGIDRDTHFDPSLVDEAFAGAQAARTLLGIPAAVPSALAPASVAAADAVSAVGASQNDASSDHVSPDGVSKPVVQETEATTVPHPADRAGDPRPRFDDNPLIAEFAPQRLRSRVAFEGFGPLVSPTRAFSDGIQQPITETALDISGGSGDAQRVPQPGRVIPWRKVGLAAGCFALVGGVALALRVEPIAREVSTEVSPLTPSPPDPSQAARDARPATQVLAAVPEPAQAAPVPSENHDSAPPALEPVPAATAPGERASELSPIPASERVVDDGAIDELFALETRSESYRCAVPAPAGTSPGTDAVAATSAATASAATTTGAQLWREWRHAQQNGDAEGAQLTLCELRQTSPADPRVYTELGALALRWGDAQGAEVAARAGLLLRPADAALKQLLGDALALRGDTAESRRLWLEPFGGDAPANRREATRFFEQRGTAALERSDFAKARTFFRRAVITSAASVRSSAGLSEALSGLGEMPAAVAWARRATLAAPRDAELQMFYGDALYRAGDQSAARQAWSAAAQLGRTPAIRRRLSKGHP